MILLQTWYLIRPEEMRKLSIVTITVAATGALLNFVVIIAMAIDPLKILRKGPWVTILNLAIADLISCISGFCLWGRKVYPYNNKEVYGVVSNFGWGFGVSASFLWLTFFTVQIFAITKFPLKSRYWFTTLKIIFVGIAVWIFAFLGGFSQITYHFHIPLMTSLKIWTAHIGVLQIALVVQIVLNVQVAVEILKSGRISGNPQNAKHRNIAKTVIILTMILFLTAFPYFVLKQLELLVRLGYFGQNKTAGVFFHLSYCYIPIAILNFTANPVLYSLRLPDYRHTLLAFFGKSNRTRGRPEISTRGLTQNISLSLRSKRASEILRGKK